MSYRSEKLFFNANEKEEHEIESFFLYFPYYYPPHSLLSQLCMRNVMWKFKEIQKMRKWLSGKNT